MVQCHLSVEKWQFFLYLICACSATCRYQISLEYSNWFSLQYHLNTCSLIMTILYILLSFLSSSVSFLTIKLISNRMMFFRWKCIAGRTCCYIWNVSFSEKKKSLIYESPFIIMKVMFLTKGSTIDWTVIDKTLRT